MDAGSREQAGTEDGEPDPAGGDPRHPEHAGPGDTPVGPDTAAADRPGPDPAADGPPANAAADGPPANAGGPGAGAATPPPRSGPGTAASPDTTPSWSGPGTPASPDTGPQTTATPPTWSGPGTAAASRADPTGSHTTATPPSWSGPGTAAAGPGTARADWSGPGTAAAPGTAAGPPTAAGPGAVGRRSGRSSRRNSSRRNSSSRGRLGAGMVDVPAIPPVDPASALLADPQLAEEKRFCRTCGKPVGRSVDGRPGEVAGTCPRDGTPFSFTPALRAGDVVADQYEVRGALAHGGLGWIYLALDRNVENRWVVLKGMVDAGDADAMAAAIAERRFLAQVSHPSIVTIHNFVQHPGDDGHPVGYIVMEYVGGSSLRDLLDATRREDGSPEPMPVPRAIAYAMDILPALGHLHSLGLAYCDFKPENVIQYDRQLKLIDLGAVIRMDDRRSALFGTVGYQAPEIPTDGPSPSSDVYTVGRTLAVLALGMSPTRGGAPAALPAAADHPVLAEHESFDRLLRRATDPDPLRRFDSTDDMVDQLAGVLREVLATLDGQPRPAMSTVFGPARGAFAPDLLIEDGEPGRPDPAVVAARLPVPLVDPSDQAAALLATATVVDPEEIARLVADTAEPSRELRLRWVRAHLEHADPQAAGPLLDELAAEDADDWRLDWYRGVTALVAGAPADAVGFLDAVYSALPGEPAVKLALAAAAECAGQDDRAEGLYQLVGRVDRSQADALFGVARMRIRAGDRAGALHVLDAVPDTSNRYLAAQLCAVQTILLGAGGAAVGEPELRAAAARVERLPLDPATDQEVRADLLSAAIHAVADRPAVQDAPFLGARWTERELRLALEHCLRTSARLAADPANRIALVDRANAVHPPTWW